MSRPGGLGNSWQIERGAVAVVCIRFLHLIGANPALLLLRVTVVV